MPQDILRTLDELDGLKKSARAEHEWKRDGDESPYSAIREADGVRITTNDYETGTGMDVEDVDYIVTLHNAYSALSDALRRAMAVVEGIKELKDAPKICVHPVRDSDGSVVECPCQKFDRLLRENGFGE